MYFRNRGCAAGPMRAGVPRAPMMMATTRSDVFDTFCVPDKAKYAGCCELVVGRFIDTHLALRPRRAETVDDVNSLHFCRHNSTLIGAG